MNLLPKSFSQRPLIGYTGGYKSMNTLQFMIFISILLRGGRPLKLRHDKAHYDKNLDGLIIGGGTDVDPQLYKCDRLENYLYDHPRDEMELAWLKTAEDKNIPVLGICRGAQLMNVARGGSLYMDLEKVYENAKYPSGLMAQIFYRKRMLVKKATLLHSLLRSDSMRVNSLHKQAINKVGQGLIISGEENNGVVQAVEDPSRPFFLGVQFHPELLIYAIQYRRIFKRLIMAAKKQL